MEGSGWVNNNNNMMMMMIHDFTESSAAPQLRTPMPLAGPGDDTEVPPIH
jgi:hypothetical protein